MSLKYIIGQLLGILSFGIGIALFLIKSDKKFKSVMAGNSILAAVHLFLIDAVSGGVASLVTAVRVFLSRYTQFRWMGAVFVLAYIYVGYRSAVSLIDWAPSAACILGTVAMYFLKSIGMRLIILVGTLLWLGYYLTYFSVGGIIGEISILVINSITIWRLWRDKTLAKA